MNIRFVHQIETVECPRCYSIMHKNIISFHLTRCNG